MVKSILQIHCSVGALLLLAIVPSTYADIGVGGALVYHAGTITQTFDSLGTGGSSSLASLTAGTWTSTGAAATGGTGWVQQVTGGAVNATTTQTTSDGSSATAGYYNYGTTAAVDRALGSLTGASEQYYALEVLNGTSQGYTNMTLTLTAEQWRSSTFVDQLNLEYKLSPTALTTVDSGGWTAFGPADNTPAAGSATALNGNLPANQFAMGGNNISFGINAWAPGTYLYIRVRDVSTGNAGLAIDNFALAGVPEPSTWIVGAMLLGLVGVRFWGNKSRSAATLA